MFALIAPGARPRAARVGPKPAHVVVLSVVAVLLSGPCVLRFGVGEPFLGYSYYALYIWGFRPPPARRDVDVRRHRDGVARRATQQIRAARRPEPAATPARSSRWSACWRSPTRPSAGVLGLCLGIAWLFDPALLAPTPPARAAAARRVAAVAFVATNLLFAASLAPGGPVQKLSLVAPRSPGVQQPPLSLSTGAGLVALMADTLSRLGDPARHRARSPRAAGRTAARPRRGLIAFLGGAGRGLPSSG